MNQTTFANVRRRCLTGIAIVMLGLMAASSCWAQSNDFGAPSINRPTTSPYLNLFNGSNRALSLGLNYQRRVRPEQALRQNAAQTNAQVGGLQQQLNLVVGPDGNVRLPGTGHQTSFMNTQGYFAGNTANRNNSMNRSGGGMGNTMLGRR